MPNKIKKPPKLAEKLLFHTLAHSDRNNIIGDFEEFYNEILNESGFLRANLWYWKQALKSIPKFIFNSFYWSFEMFKSYLKIAIRNIRKSKGYSFINISGLAIGMACSIILLIYIHSELTWDNFHQKAHRIYRLGVHSVMNGSEVHWYVSNAVTAGVLKRDYPEVEDAIRMGGMGTPSIKYKDKIFYERDVFYADASIFNLFTYPIKTGNPETALEAPYTVVISEEMAIKYFGNEDPIGKILRFNNQYDYTITGVIYNIPENSDFSYNMLCSYNTLYAQRGQDDPQLNQWISFNFLTFVLLKENIDHKIVEAKFPAMLDHYVGPQLKAAGAEMNFFLQPFKDIHLYTPAPGRESGGAIQFVYIFSAIAFFILIIACVNFMNLSTARSAKRAREVGMRKVFGAARGRLIKQFLSESLIFSFIALIISIIFVQLFLPFISSLADRDLQMNFSQFSWLFLSFIGIATFTGVFAGFYPAFFLSAFQPIKVLKSGISSAMSHSKFRSVLVVFQFVISISLIIGTGLIINQLNYLRDKDPGFNKEHVVVIPIRSDQTLQSMPMIKTELKRDHTVKVVGISSTLPGQGAQYNQFLPEGFTREQMQLMDDIQADDGFLDAIGINIIEGRNFSREIKTDQKESVIINELAAKKYGWEYPIGKTIRRGREVYNVIGVINDVHIRPFIQTIEPICIANNIHNRFNRARFITIRIKPENIEATINFINKTWTQIQPEQPFDYYFLDDSFDNQFRIFERTKDIFSYFAIFAIFIACLGLFGMSSYTTEQRTKEIGIRKTLGASITGIIFLLNREAIKLSIIANIIAWPIIFLLMNKWLQIFPYRADTNIITFILSAILVVAIALGTIVYQSIKAAKSNPIDSLRFE